MVEVVAAGTYQIAGVLLSSTTIKTVTLDNGGTKARFDMVRINAAGTISALKGSEGDNPVIPASDPGTYLDLQAVLVPGSATTPGNATALLAYDENAGTGGTPAEWTASESTGAARIALASTVNPYQNTKDIAVTAGAAADYFMLAPASPITPSNYNALVFYIRSGAAWARQKSLQIYFATTGTQNGNIVPISEGTFGFVSATTSAYQQISIPIGLFAVPATSNQLVFKIAGSGTAISFRVDFVTLQTGIAPATSTQGSLDVTAAGGSTALTAGGLTCTRNLPTVFTISGWNIQETTVPATATSSAVFDVWVAGTYQPTVANTIISGAGVKPTLTTGISAVGSNLNGWAVSVPANYYVCFNLDSATNAKNLHLQLTGTR